MFKLILVSILIFDFYFVLCNGQIHCKDESGKNVDWFIVYKFPQLKSEPDPLKSGLSYAFIASNSNAKGWSLSKNTIDKNSFFSKTLEPLYQSKNLKNLTYIVYNDQPPGSKSEEPSFFETVAHAKGIIVSGSSSGFWLIHTVPKFVDNKPGSQYAYPSNGLRNGQVALCVSFKDTEFRKIIDYLLVIRPLIYSINSTAAIEKKVPNFADLKSKKWKAVNDHLVIDFKSSAGQSFTSYSKSPTAGKDLYADIVAPAMKSHLWVQTWRKNPGTPLPSACKKSFRVENVNFTKQNFVNAPTVRKGFSYVDDHSKWALSQDQKKPFFCVGDINRMQSQFKRGGGTTCLQSPIVWKSVRDWITGVEKC